MLDANILMVGIEKRLTDANCSFENMKTLYIEPLFKSFKHIVIHKMVYEELDEKCKQLVDSYLNVTIVEEGDLYGKDPQYTTIFNNIANHNRVNYNRLNSKNKGEIYSLAYASFYKINCFSSKEIMVDLIADELEELQDIEIITFDVIVLLALIYHVENGCTQHNKALKSLYKRFCEDVIKRNKLPTTLSEYLIACKEYI